MSNDTPKANKDLGQHYLKDKTVIQKIVGDFKTQAEAIIEVGPGPATLTRDLAALGLPFYVVERDERFLSLLGEFLAPEQIVHSDALQIDWQNFIDERDDLRGKEVWLVSNLPYNISAPLTINFIKAPSLKYMSLMYQLEVAQKVVPPPNERHKSMNSLLALTQNYYQVKSLCKVPPGAFAPPPQVQSMVLSYERRDQAAISPADFDRFERFLRHLFGQKRKQMMGVLKSNFPAPKLQEVFAALDIPVTIRAEALDLGQIQSLYAKLVTA